MSLTLHLHEKYIDVLDIVSTELLRNNNTSNLDSTIEHMYYMNMLIFI
jgi:hypothetical protein